MKSPTRTILRSLAAGLAGVAVASWAATPARALPNIHLAAQERLAEHQPATHPRLWFTRDQVGGLRQKIRSGTPQKMAALLLRDAARSLDDVAPSGRSAAAANEVLPPYVMETAMAYVLTGDRSHADRALAAIRRLAPLAAPGSLEWSARGLALSFAYDACFDAWDAAARREVAGLLVQITHTLATFDRPDAVQNNHQGITQGTRALCDLAVATEVAGVQADYESGKSKLFDYLSYYGDQGWYHEGFGYLTYASTFWAPALLAMDNVTGAKLFEGRFANMARVPHTYYTTAVTRPVQDDDGVNRFGTKLSWNDDLKSIDGVGMNLMFGYAPRQELGALRFSWERLIGQQGNQSFGRGTGGLVWGILYYPSATPEQEPNSIWPRTVVDTRQGAALFRNTFHGADDIVLGVYAKQFGFSHIHAANDAGSWRLLGLDGGWSVGGGEAKKNAAYQSVVVMRSPNVPPIGVPLDMPLPAGYQDPVEGTQGTGKLTGFAVRGDGSGSVVMDLTANMRIPVASRAVAVDYSGLSGAPAVVAFRDRYEAAQEQAWDWTMCIENTDSVQLEPARNGFTVTAPTGATLVVRFAPGAKLEFAVMHGPPTDRGFESGRQTEYAGATYVRATQLGARVAFDVVMTLQKTAAPPVRFQSDLAHLGPQTIRFEPGLAIGP